MLCLTPFFVLQESQEESQDSGCGSGNDTQVFVTTLAQFIISLLLDIALLCWGAKKREN